MLILPGESPCSSHHTSKSLYISGKLRLWFGNTALPYLRKWVSILGNNLMCLTTSSLVAKGFAAPSPVADISIFWCFKFSSPTKSTRRYTKDISDFKQTTSTSSRTWMILLQCFELVLKNLRRHSTMSKSSRTVVDWSCRFLTSLCAL